MKKKKYVPVHFLPPTNEKYQENYDQIFRKGKARKEPRPSLKERSEQSPRIDYDSHPAT